MALNKTQLEQGILTLMNDMMTRTEPSNEEFASRMANLIDAFVKTGSVTVGAGITVSTTGTATAQTGATTATGTGTIS